MTYGWLSREGSSQSLHVSVTADYSSLLERDFLTRDPHSWCDQRDSHCICGHMHSHDCFLCSADRPCLLVSSCTSGSSFLGSHLGAFTNDHNVIYVDMSATILTTVASWSSTMAPLVLPFLLTLVSFPVARTMMRASQNGDRARQPTPYQLALILKLLSNASLGSLWRCITYLFTSTKKRAALTKPLAVMTWLLLMASLLR